MEGSQIALGYSPILSLRLFGPGFDGDILIFSLDTSLVSVGVIRYDLRLEP